jgi:prolyl-tRNA synthetase
MRLSSGFVPTLKEEPSDAVMPSHKLMIRAGMVRPLAAGIYSFLPLGWKVAQKVMQIIREEMNAIGGQEFHLPALNPIELWEETGRLRDFGDVIFQLKNRPLVLAPTHEEVICHIAKHHIKSYKDLPQIWYQIQTKFRNEPRPRSGVIRVRQFIMKDSYSLDASWEGLDRSYELHRQAYIKIYTRCGLKFFIVGASTGAMGGSASEEFMVESPYGEDTVVLCDRCGYSANTEIAQSNVPPAKRYPESKPFEEIYTPNVRTINELAQFLNVSTDILAKSLVYKHNGQPVLILMLGNDQLVEAKLLKALGGGEIAPMEPEELKKLTGANAGSIGPIGLKNFKIIADNRLKGANNLISGANKDDYHIANIDMERDVKVDGYFDLRKVEEGEPCINCGNPLRIVNAIEIGHIFKLGTKYSEAMKATFLDENGQEKPIIMGSYGIGVERIIACHIEQNHDENGIIWDKSIAPFLVHLISVNTEIPNVVQTAEKLYDKFNAEKIEVIYDDRTDVSPGFKFKDADLLGMPLQIIVSERNLKNNQVEIKIRRTGERILVNIDDVVAKVRKILEL